MKRFITFYAIVEQFAERVTIVETFTCKKISEERLVFWQDTYPSKKYTVCEDMVLVDIDLTIK